MSDSINKKLSELLGKVDERVLQAKINSAIDMLQKGNTDELARKINKMDKEELLSKINEFDESKLKDLKLNKDEIKQKVSEADFQKLASLIGHEGDAVVRKIKEILK